MDVACPPTVPFTVEDDEDEIATCALPKTPVFEQVQDPRKFPVLGGVSGGGVVAFQHEQNTPEVDTVENIVRRALPHARERHFRQFLFRGIEVRWRS